MAGSMSRAEKSLLAGDVYPGWQMRDLLAAEFRHTLCENLTAFSPPELPGVGMVPFEHQADWWAASEGKVLSGTGHPYEDVLQEWEKQGNFRHLELPSKILLQGHEYWRIRRATDDGLGSTFEYQRLLQRPKGLARVLWQIGSFKSGKSLPAAVWMASFGICPMLEWDMIGLTYDTSSPEFEYLEKFLLSSGGLGLKAERHVNNPKGGDIQIKLENGATFTVRSYDRAEGLEGKERDGYTFTEAYQLPGIEVYDDISQNLEKRNGYGHFPTTPKRPWVGVAAKLANGGDPDFDHWHVVADIPRWANPEAFNPKTMAAQRKTMTSETFAFSWEGKLSSFVGAVYEYDEETCTFTTSTHPELWKDPEGPMVVENLRIPDSWERVNAADTGTFRAAVIGVADDRGHVYFLFETCNYRYVGTKIEEITDVTIPVWASRMKDCARRVGSKFYFKADHNTQFKSTLRVEHKVILTKGVKDPVLRTDLLKGLFKQRKVWLAPWLVMLPKEIEDAVYPPKTSEVSGILRRIKKDDHLLDCAEHIGASLTVADEEEEEKDPKDMTPMELMKYRHGAVIREETSNPWTGDVR